MKNRSFFQLMPVFTFGAVVSACGGGAGSTAAGGAGGTTDSGGAGGSSQACADVVCSGAGEVCVDGACVVDCRKSGAQPCAEGTACDVSNANAGKCVALGTPCLTTSEPQPCGDKSCGPGSACDGAGQCYPRVPCQGVQCNGSACFGVSCACERAHPCDVAPLGEVDAGGIGSPGTLHDDTFRAGLTDLDFDPACGAWGVTILSADSLRHLTPAGDIDIFPGVTNLDMGEVSTLQQVVVPRSGVLAEPPVDVALTYICCETCGCVLNQAAQGVARRDPATGDLPFVIQSKTYTNGTGPFGSYVLDTGPAGLSYGLDQVLYIGNIDANGEYYRVDLDTKKQTLITTLPARVYQSTPFDYLSNLVAIEGGDLYLVRTDSGEITKWGSSDQPVTGLVRDLFDGSVYVARADLSILKYTPDGKPAPFQTTQYPSRISIAPDGFLYAIESPPPYYDHIPIIERWQLPGTR